MNYVTPLTRMLVPTLALVALFAGCAGTPPARFYTLTSMAQPQAGQPAAAAQNVSVNIAPVEIPDYLNRLQIVTKDGRNELKLAEFDRWAGSLAENMAVVLAENLSQLLGSEQVFVHPRVQAATPDYTLAVRVLQLDCIPGDQVRLKAQWTVLAGAERKETVTRMSNISEKLEDKQYETMVAAVSRTLEQLSSEIAREIQAQSAGR
jgi:hypothetical protein